MEFKIGDRVSFLNEKGGGVIVSIKDKQTVVVSEDDGFSTPYLIKKLVKVNKPVSVIKEDLQFPTLGNEAQQISLLFVPKDSNKILDCDFDLQLVNNSGTNFYFELYQFEVDKILLISSGQVAEGMTHLVKSIKREEIEAYCKLKFQCLFNSKKKMNPMQPYHEEVNIKASKFFKTNNFTFSSFVNNMAICIKLADENALSLLKQKNLDINEQFSDKDFVTLERKSIPNHYLRKDEEVDLHISEILENQMGMSAIQLLQIQLNLFKKELEKAIQFNYASITFIHGIGKGVLKESILKELSHYKGIKYYPANFQKYGNGATKVEII
jgi:hypothetical protein